jgi:chromosome segregation ATPase
MNEAYLNESDIYADQHGGMINADGDNDYGNNNDNDDDDFNGFDECAVSDKQLKSIYQELAEKEEALLLAAQFGKNLIDEKEELERQVELLKREQQTQLETYEQETYQLRRLIESMKNEYESKIYELNDDIGILGKKLKESERNMPSSFSRYEIHNEELELIQELKERNTSLANQLNSSESQLSSANENTQMLENKIDEKEKVIDENARLLSSYQKEIAKLMKKQQEMEYVLMQTCNERDKQAKIMEELSNKYILLENDKSELENLVC